MPSFGPISSHPVSGLFPAKERKDVSASMDAAIAHINIEAMAGMDAAIQLFASNRVDIDAILKNFGVAGDVAIEAALQTGKMVDGSMDSVIQLGAEQGADINAILVKLIKSYLSVNAALQVPDRSAGLQADSALEATGNLKVVDVDGQLLISGVEQGQIDSCLAQLSAESFADFDGALVLGLDKNLLLTALLKIAGELPVGLDAIMLPDISNRPAYAWLQYPDKLEAFRCLTEMRQIQCQNEIAWIKHPDQDLALQHADKIQELPNSDRARQVPYPDKAGGVAHPENLQGIQHPDGIQRLLHPDGIREVQYPDQTRQAERPEEDREVESQDKIRKNEHPGNAAGVEHEDKIYPIR